MKMSCICGALNSLYFFCARTCNYSRNYTCFKNINSNQEIQKSEITHLKPVIEWKDTINFIPPIKGGEVIKVYDGDTITIASKLPYDSSPLYRFSVRLNGIDAPEIKGKTEDEKTAAKVSQKALEELILHKNVTLENMSTEKYGRILADVFYNEINLNQWMLKNHYAIEYDGGTKKSPESWLDYQSTGIVK